MEYSIWKYRLEFKSEQTILIPQSAQILNIKTIDDEPYLFAWVEIQNYYTDKEDKMVIVMYDTNHTFSGSNLRYIDSIQDYRGIVKHVFEKK